MGWVRSRLDAARRLKRQVGGDAFALELEDGTRKMFSRADFYGNF